MYYTYHINDAILSQCFTSSTKLVKSSPTPFKAYIPFELFLAETLPVTPYELHHLEERYLGKFSAHIGKLLIIMQHTRPNIMFVANRVSRYTATLSVPALQSIKHIV